MEKNDFKLDQTVYLKIIQGSNRARRIINKSDTNEWIVEKVVTKIGNKYITVADKDNHEWSEEKFNVQNDFGHVYVCGGQDYKLYLTKEEILEDLESEKMYHAIKNKFSDFQNKGRYSSDKLKKVLKILG